MLTLAGEKTLRKHAEKRIQFLEADAQKLPLPDGMFQITCVAFGLRNVTNFERGLFEMVRVTKRGGKVAILEFSKPRNLLFGSLYRFYFRYLLPVVGQAISRSDDNAYSYLPVSVLAFPDGEGLAEHMVASGLHEVHWRPLTFGIATLGAAGQRRWYDH